MAVDIETIGVGVDTSGVKSGTAALNDFGKSADNAGVKADRLSKQTKDQSDKFASLQKELQNTNRLMAQGVSAQEAMRASSLAAAGATNAQIDAIIKLERQQATLQSNQHSSYLTGLAASYLSVAAAVTTVVSIMKQAIAQAEEAAQAQLKLQAVYKNSGDTLGFTIKQLNDMADAMANSTSFDDESIRGGMAELIKFGNIHGKVFKEALQVTADYAAFTGQSFPAAAAEMGKALADTEHAARLLRTMGVAPLDEAQKDLIKELQLSGNEAEAQMIILDKLKTAYAGVDASLRSGLTGAIGELKKAWNEFMEAVGKSAVGDTATGVIGSITEHLKAMKRVIEDGDWMDKYLMAAFGYVSSSFKGEKVAEWHSFEMPKNPNSIGGAGAITFGPSIGMNSSVKFSSGKDSGGGWNPAFKAKAKVQKDWYAELLKDQADMDYATMNQVSDYRLKMLADDQKYWKDFEEQNKKDELNDIEQIAEKRNKLLAETQKLREEEEAKMLKIARDDQDALTEQTLKAIEKQQAEWQKMTDDINRMLGDALMSAFEAGKGWGKSFIETLQNMFNTLVLRPIISAIVSPIGGAISAGVTGLLSSGGAMASTGASGGGFGSVLSAGQSLWSAFSGGTSAMMEGFASSTVGAALGLSSLEGAAAQTAMSMGMMADTLGTLTTAGSALVSAAPFIAAGVGIVGLLAGGGLGGLFGGGHVMRPKAYANTSVSATSVSTLNSRTTDGADASWAIKPGMELGAYLQAAAKQFGAEIVNGFVVGTKYMKKYNSLEITVGKSITKTNSELMFDMGAEGAGANAAALTFITAVRKNLIAVDGYLGNLIRNSDAYNTTAASVIQNILALKGLHDSLDTMPPVFARIKTYIEAMVNVSSNGGLAGLTALTKATQTFYGLFYSEAQQQADLSKSLHTQLAALNVAFPATREGFRALVESSTGMTRFTSLVNLAPAMDQYYKALESQADVTRQAADAAKQLAEQMADALSPDKFRTLVDYTRAQNYIRNGIQYPVLPDPASPQAPLMARLSDPHANNAAVLAELRKVREELAASREALADIKRTNRNMDRTNEKWDGDGLPATRA